MKDVDFLHLRAGQGTGQGMYTMRSLSDCMFTSSGHL